MKACSRSTDSRSLLCGAVALLLLASVDASASTATHTPPAFAEPVTLASENGVLEVTLSARQGAAKLDTVAAPAQNLMLFAYELQRGKASNGKRADANLYPGPTLQVEPGETLIVHMVNELADLTIPDFYDPAFIAKGAPVPLYPRQLTSSPFNLHTHGLHVSPAGNSDNVLLNIPAGFTNTYTYRIPADHPQGLYWYHSHRHGLTTQQTYFGLAGLLVIGRADGNLPLVTEHAIPVRTMAIQYNYVFDRKGGRTTVNNPYWSQFVSTLREPSAEDLAKGTYEPKLTPLNFWQSKKGTQFFTVWWAGPLSIYNNRGQFQFIPENLQGFASNDGKIKIPPDPKLPDHQRDLQFTVNGQFQPRLRIKPGQTEIWVLANVSDVAYARVRLTETATGKHPPIAIVGQDGNPFPAVHHAPIDGGTTLLIPPANRFAIAVTMPASGDLVLEMPPDPSREAVTRPGVLYTNDGSDHPPAVLGKVTVEASAISYFDGFFETPVQVLLRAEPDKGTGKTTPFAEGQALNALTSFVDLTQEQPAVERSLLVSGGFLNEHASKQDPKAFTYAFDDNTFPNVPLLQPRLGSVEQWSFINHNNDSHPIHIHVNDFQVIEIGDPTNSGSGDSGAQPWGADNADLPMPKLGPEEAVIAPGTLRLRSKFTEFTGAYVVHCHRLNHEDNGLMTFVNVIPAVSSYAIGSDGAPGRDATVRVLDGNGDTPLATVTPFPGFQGTLSVTMGDVDGDQILDLVAGKGAGGSPEVVAFSGASDAGGAPFARELLRFLAFDESFQGGVRVAAAGIDGNPMADNVIVATGAGIESSVKIFGSTLPKVGSAPEVFASFSPYPESTTGVTVAAGLVDAESGRASIVTAPGPGTPAEIKSFRFDLYKPNSGAAAWCAPTDPLPPGVPRLASEFLAFDGTYPGGVSLAVGWVAGAYGGAQAIVVAQDAAPGFVKVFSSGSALDGNPEAYLESPDQHGGSVSYREIVSFTPFPDAPSSGVRIATTSTTSGADVLVSGLDATGKTGRVRKYGFERSAPTARTLTPSVRSEVAGSAANGPSWIGGDS